MSTETPPQPRIQYLCTVHEEVAEDSRHGDLVTAASPEEAVQQFMYELYDDPECYNMDTNINVWYVKLRLRHPLAQPAKWWTFQVNVQRAFNAKLMNEIEFKRPAPEAP